MRYAYPSVRPAASLDQWITDQMVTDHRRVQEMQYAGPPNEHEEALVDHAVRRKLLALHARHHTTCEECREDDGERASWPCETVRIVILKWANRPGYVPWATPAHTSPDTSKG